MNLSVVYWAVIAIGLLGIEKSFAQEDTKPPTFGHVGTVPPEEAVLAAIDLMRIEIEQFQFELPSRRTNFGFDQIPGIRMEKNI